MQSCCQRSRDWRRLLQVGCVGRHAPCRCSWRAYGQDTVFSLPLSSVGSFATVNNMSINVYGADDDKKVIYPLCCVDMLLFERAGTQHYTAIRNFRKLVGSQISNHEHVVYCCKKCLHAYKSQELLDVHATDCCHAQRTKFPEDPRCRFTNIQKHADFESILKPVDEEVDTTQGVEVVDESSSHVFQDNAPCNTAYTSHDLSSCIEARFVRDLQKEAKQLFEEYIATPKPMLLAATELRSFNNGTTCHVCTNRLEMIKCEIIVTL